MENQDLRQKIEDLPQTAGVYFFKDANERVIYVGKAKNLKKRVKNHFQKPDQHAFDFISQVADIDFILADSESAALILEQQFIKKLQPRWNTEWKDDKNYFYIALSAGPFTRVSLTHQPFAGFAGVQPPEIQGAKCGGAKCGGLTPAKKSPKNCNTLTIAEYFGPFVSGREVKSFLREIRKALPYRSCRNLPKKSCFYQSLGLCAAPCLHKKRKAAYNQMLVVLKILLRIYQGTSGNCGDPTPGKSLRELRGFNPRNRQMRVECYDVSNLAGTLAVGSMAVFENGKPNKSQYRKFRIKTIQGQNDVASLREILARRLKHSEWPMPDLIVLDGGKGQLKAARGIKNIPVMALAKIGDKDGKLFTKFSKNYAQLSKLPNNIAHIILNVRDEAHRFAITYNKKRRNEKFK